MNITFSPQVSPQKSQTSVEVSGDTLIFEGVFYDLSSVPDGGEAEPQGEHPFVGKITREGGVVNVKVVVNPPDNASDSQPKDVNHWKFNNVGGVVEIPWVY